MERRGEKCRLSLGGVPVGARRRERPASRVSLAQRPLRSRALLRRLCLGGQRRFCSPQLPLKKAPPELPRESGSSPSVGWAAESSEEREALPRRASCVLQRSLLHYSTLTPCSQSATYNSESRRWVNRKRACRRPPSRCAAATRTAREARRRAARRADAAAADSASPG